MIGLKKDTVQLCEHEKEWETEAQKTISKLKKILGCVIKDIQHVGSTSIPTIKAKPIIDIAVAVDSFDDVLKFQVQLESAGFYYRPDAQATLAEQLLFACGSYYDGSGDLQTHFIHVVLTDSSEWINYINFRNYLIDNPTVAKEYEKLKVSLAKAAPVDSQRKHYLAGKHDFIVNILHKALNESSGSGSLSVTVHADGSADIVYNDYGTDSFFDEDYEVTYRLDADRFSRLLDLLGCPSTDEAKEYIIRKFGKKLERLDFGEFCSNNEIEFKRNVWIG